MKNIIQLQNVSFCYQTLDDEILAVKDISFSCKEGVFTSIIGPSGCGKTTILSLMAGIIKPTSGRILYDENKPEIGYMLQKDHLLNWRNIEKNVFLPLELKHKNTIENKKYTINLLEKYGLKDFRKSYPYQLSGGMRQRVALIRTLSFNPNLLLLDEPFSALDYQTRLSVCDDVYNIIRKENKTAILVTHDISEAISMSDEIIVLSKRPATIKTKVYPSLEGSPLKRRESPEFGKLFEKLWKELNQ